MTSLIIVTLQKRKSSRFDTFVFDSSKFNEFEALQQAVIWTNEANGMLQSEKDIIITDGMRAEIETYVDKFDNVTEIRRAINPIVATIRHHRIITEKFQRSTK